MDFQKAFDAGFDALKGYVDRSFGAVYDRIKALEANIPERGEKGETGDKGVDGAPGKNGRDGVGLADIVRDADGNLIAVLSDGRTKSIGNITVRDGNDGRDGIDGNDAPALTQDQIADAILSMPGVIEAAVYKYLADNPPPAGRDGKDGSPGANGKDGINGKDGSDGIGLADAFQDAEGNLVITDTKGGVHNVGRVRGYDGLPGSNGKDGVPGADGKNGRDGIDGFGFDDLSVEHNGLRKVTLKFTKGERVKTFDINVPVVLDAGVYKSGVEYKAGDGVTFGGHYWIAENDNPEGKPDTGKGWRMAVRKGRDGKDGIAGERGERGPEGRAGRDLTQLGLDGDKW